MTATLSLDDYLPRRSGTETAYERIEQALNVGRVHGQWRVAARTIEQAIEQFVALGDPQGEHRARAKAAIVYHHLGDTARATEHATMAMRHFEQAEQAEPLFFGTAALELGQVQEAAGDLAAAQAVYERALAQLRPEEKSATLDAALLRARIEDCAANVFARQRDFERAAPLRAAALATFEAQQVRFDAVTTLCNLAKDELACGQTASALDHLGRAETHLVHLDDPYSSAQAHEVVFHLSRKALSGLATGERGAAAERARAAAWSAVSNFEVTGMQGRAVQMLLEIASLEIDLGRPEAATQPLAVVARRIAGGAGPAGPDRARLHGRFEALRARLTETGESIPRPAPALQNAGNAPDFVIRFGSPPTEAPIPLSGVPEPAFRSDRPEVSLLAPHFWAGLDAERALQEVERIKSADLLRMLRWHRGVHDTRPIDVADTGLRDALGPLALNPTAGPGPSEVFVDYYCCDERILAFVQTADAPPRCSTLEVTADEVLQAVQSLRTRFDGGGARLGIVRNHPFRVGTEAIDRIGARLLPFLDELTGAGIVCIFPSGPLSQFPFQAVRDAAGVPLLEHFAIAYGLSRRLVASARTRHGHGPGRVSVPARASVVAVPAPQERHPELYGGDGDFLAGLGLVVTALETPSLVTLPRVLDAMASADLLHFNCHGEFDAGHPLESALLLAGGQRLDARQVFSLRLQAQTAVLRACSSGVTRVRDGDEQEGLLRAFVHAGVGCCLVARWKVDVESSRELIRCFYREWIGGQAPRAIALQRAALEVMNRAEFGFYRHPYHWAPFALVGEWW